MTTKKKSGAAHHEWTVLRHGPLERLAENLLWTWGALPGMSLRRTMTVAKRSDGRLVIYNSIALDEAGMKELEALGEPGFLIVPNRMHRLDAPAFKNRYPGLTVLAPRGGRAAIAKVVDVDGAFEDYPADDTVRLEMLQGVADSEGAMLVRSSDGTTVVLNDVMFNMDHKKDLIGRVITTVLGSAPGPRVSRLAKLLLVKDKAALRGDFERFGAIEDLARVIVAHEKVASGDDAREALRKAATFL
jgi:hypothetical protein